MYEQDVESNNLQGLTYRKTQPANQSTKCTSHNIRAGLPAHQMLLVG